MDELLPGPAMNLTLILRVGFSEYNAYCQYSRRCCKIILHVFDNVQELAGSQVSSLLHPILADQLPTYHRLNKFTRAFQVINDAYGVACYKEVNPGTKLMSSSSLTL